MSELPAGMNEQQADAIITLLTSIDQKLELMIGAVLTVSHEPDPSMTAASVSSWDDVPGPSFDTQARCGG